MKLWGVARIVAAVVVMAAAAGAVVAYSGAYNVAADVPHTRPVFWLLSTARDRSIAARTGAVQAPADLVDTARVVAGAGLYDDMCASCHLAPGMEKTEISQGLYPRAPQLARRRHPSAVQDFWVIKHGLKETGMAAWGKTHSDTLIWDMVAFLQKLPALSSEQYQALVKSAPMDHDEMMKADGMAR